MLPRVDIVEGSFFGKKDISILIPNIIRAQMTVTFPIFLPKKVP